MLTLIRGQKIKLAALTPATSLKVSLTIHGPAGITFDISCFGLDSQDKLSDDRYFIFYNQKESPCGSLRILGAGNGDHEQFQLDLSRLPAFIRKLVFVVTIDGDEVMSQIDDGYLRILDPVIDVGRFAFSGADFGNERALIVGEVYFKDVWRFSAVGQGFDGGLNALLKYFGGEEETEPQLPVPPPAAAPQPPVSPPAEVPHLPVPPPMDPSPPHRPSPKSTCRRCGKELSLLSHLGIGYNKQTGRCRKCESENANALKRFRNGFLHYCKDGVLTDAEWDSLRRGAQKEGIAWAEALAFVRGDALHFLEQTLANAASDGLISEAEGAKIRQLRLALEIPQLQAQPILDQLSHLEKITVLHRLNRFRNDFLQYCKDGVLTDAEWESLRRGAQKEGIAWAEALAFVRGDALYFLEQTLANAASDGLISEAEGANIRQLRLALEIPQLQAQPILDRLSHLERITVIRKGNLPTIQTRVQIDSDELCHLECDATYHKVGARSTTAIPGRIIATNKRLHFLSSGGGTEMTWKNIMRIDCQSTGIYLELSKKAGNGYYGVADPLYTEAILDTLVRLAKRQLLLPQSTDTTRHIPHEIKQAVWQRDQGKCVQCGATSYLEFDHIIPYSKGGANTVENVQLLCRRCNLQKGDRI